jgi:hypothetical protein
MGLGKFGSTPEEKTAQQFTKAHAEATETEEPSGTPPVGVRGSGGEDNVDVLIVGSGKSRYLWLPISSTALTESKPLLCRRYAFFVVD